VIELKTPAEIERMHVAGRFVAEVLSEVGRLADVGVNLLDLEHHVRDMITSRGAESCYGDYAPSFGSGPFRRGNRSRGGPADHPRDRGSVGGGDRGGASG
jgi:methionyl aminopeptidase